MHGAVCLVFPAPENRKQQWSSGGSCSWEVSSPTHFGLCLQERGKAPLSLPSTAGHGGTWRGRAAPGAGLELGVAGAALWQHTAGCKGREQRAVSWLRKHCQPAPGPCSFLRADGPNAAFISDAISARGGLLLTPISSCDRQLFLWARTQPYRRRSLFSFYIIPALLFLLPRAVLVQSRRWSDSAWAGACCSLLLKCWV